MTHREINEQQRVLQFKAIGVRLENLAAARGPGADVPHTRRHTG